MKTLRKFETDIRMSKYREIDLLIMHATRKVATRNMYETQ